MTPSRRRREARRNREKRCRRKLTYTTEDEARGTAAMQSDVFGKPMYAYPCDATGQLHWHTSSVPHEILPGDGQHQPKRRT